MLPEGKVSGQNQHGYTIHKVDRFDAGRYTCKADNGVGTPATAHIALQVLCKYQGLFIVCLRHGKKSWSQRKNFSSFLPFLPNCLCKTNGYMSTHVPIQSVR